MAEIRTMQPFRFAAYTFFAMRQELNGYDKQELRSLAHELGFDTNKKQRKEDLFDLVYKECVRRFEQ